MFKSIQDESISKDLNQRFAFIKNQNYPQSVPMKKKKQKLQDSFLKNSNFSRSPYQEPQSIQSPHDSFLNQESQHSASQHSTFSFHEYKEILNNLFQNSQHEEEWKQVPQIVKLIIKAISLSINAIENKVVENREIINDQGIQIKENKLSLQSLSKGFKKLDGKVSTLKIEESIIQSNQQKQKMKSFLKQKQQSEQNQFLIKGLDMIMIQEVKTITDAIISKRIQDVIDQIQELEEKLQQKYTQQHQKLQGEIQALKTWIPQLQVKQKLQQQKFQQNFKQQLAIIDQKSSHLLKQLKDEKQTMCDLGHYIEEQFCKKQEINQLFKTNYDNKPSKNFNYDSVNYNSANLNKNKVQEMVKYQIDSFQLLRKKQFDEFKQKIMKNINTFATVSEVQKIVNKTNKHSKPERANQNVQQQFYHQKDQETLELKKSKNVYQKIQGKSRQKSPLQKKVKASKASKKQSEKQIQSSKTFKNPGKQRKISQFSHQQSIYDSPIIVDEKSYKTKSTPLDQSEINAEKYQIYQEIQQTLMKKIETKMKQMKQFTKENIEQQINSQLSKLQKKLTKRLQTAEEQFCAVVEQNWRTMSQNNLKIQKEEKQNMENLLKVVSVLNVIARYSTIVNCDSNSCIRWQKQVFNSTGKGVLTLSSDKTIIYVGTAGVYAVHIVLYTLYDPTVSFAIQINGEQVGRRTQKIGVKTQETQKNQEIMLEDKKSHKKKQANPSNIYHPSRGVQFTSTLLIPAKSNLTIRLLTELNGQALMQIRKL